MHAQCSVVFERSIDAPSRARALVSLFLSGQELVDLVPIAALLLSELVTNAVMHASGPIAVAVRWTQEVLHVDVCDGGFGAVPVREPGEGGRGLLLVDALASAWGSTANGNGTVTWFELRRD